MSQLKSSGLYSHHLAKNLRMERVRQGRPATLVSNRSKVNRSGNSALSLLHLLPVIMLIGVGMAVAAIAFMGEILAGGIIVSREM